MTWFVFSYLNHDGVFLRDLDNNVFLLCYSFLQRYISQLSQPPMYFFYVILFYKDISQLSQPPPSTPWFVMLTWFAMLGLITWPTLPPGLLECGGSEWNGDVSGFVVWEDSLWAPGVWGQRVVSFPLRVSPKYMIERTMAKIYYRAQKEFRSNKRKKDVSVLWKWQD